MSPHKSSLIVIHFLNDPNEFNFDDSLIDQLRAVVSLETNILEMDNFSDSVTLSYTSELVKSKKLVIILTGQLEASLGKASTILNQTIRHQNLQLLALNDIQAAKPFMTRMKVKIVDFNELVESLE